MSKEPSNPLNVDWKTYYNEPQNKKEMDEIMNKIKEYLNETKRNRTEQQS